MLEFALPSKNGRLYQGYTANTVRAVAYLKFKAKYGYKPEEIKRNPGAVLAGPIRRSDNA